MSKENSKKTTNQKKMRCDEEKENSDSEDAGESPSRRVRQVLSENLISPHRTPIVCLPHVSRKSSSPSSETLEVGGGLSCSPSTSTKQRQSTSSPNSTANASNNEESPPKEISRQMTHESTAMESVSSSLMDTNHGPTNGTFSSVQIPPGTSSTGRFHDSPLVFVASTLFEAYSDELSSNLEESEPVNLAADVQISDFSVGNPSNLPPTSPQADDSDSNESSSDELTTSTPLMLEIRTVFALIADYVSSQMKKTRKKTKTLKEHLSRRRQFVAIRNSQGPVELPTNAQRLATHLLSTMPEHEGNEFTYQVSSSTFDQWSSSNPGSYGCLSHESPEEFAGKSSGEDLLVRGRAGASSREPQCGSKQASSGGSRSRSAGASSQESKCGTTQGSSEGSRRRSAGASSQNPQCGSTQAFHGDFSRGYALGLTMGSERFAQTTSGRLAQNVMAHRIQQQRIPQDIYNSAADLFPRGPPQATTGSTPPGLLHEYFRGVHLGFSRAYSRWSARRSIPGSTQGSARGASQRSSRGTAQRYADDSAQGSFRGVAQGSYASGSSPGSKRGAAQSSSRGTAQGYADDSAQGSFGGAAQGSYPSGSSPGSKRGAAQSLSRGTAQGYADDSAQGSFRGAAHPPGSSRGSARGAPQSSFRRTAQGYAGESAQGLFRGAAHRYSRGSAQRSSRGIAQGSNRGAAQELLSGSPRRRQNQETVSEISEMSMEERIHVLLVQLVRDVNMMRGLAELILKEYENIHAINFEQVSNYLICFEIMREDYREKEIRFTNLEREVIADIEHCRDEAFSILHLKMLIDILENCISRVQYGTLLIKMHENRAQVRTISSNVNKLAIIACSFEMWSI